MVPPPDLNADGGDNPNGPDDPKFVTVDQLNAAVSGHMKRLESRLGQTIGNVIAEQLKGLAPKPPADDPPLDDPKDPPTPDGTKANPEITSLKRQLSTLTNKLQKAEDERDADKASARSSKLRTDVLKTLGEAGLSGPHLKAASAVLYQDGKVNVGDDGVHLFTNSEGLEVPLTDGVKEWVASDDAKLFLPPKDVRGSGDSGDAGTKLPKLKTDELSQAHADAIEGVAKHLLNE